MNIIKINHSQWLNKLIRINEIWQLLSSLLLFFGGASWLHHINQAHLFIGLCVASTLVGIIKIRK